MPALHKTSQKPWSRWLDRRKEGLAAMFFLAPNFLGFLTFLAFPVILSIILAMSDYKFRLGGTWEFVGFRNFYDLLTHGNFWFYFYNTIFLMLGIPISIAGSLFLAVLLTRKLKGIVFFRTMFYLPHFTSGVAMLVLWRHLYNPEFGPINAVLRPVMYAFENAAKSYPSWIFKVGG